MTKFLSEEERQEFAYWMDNASDGTSILVRWSGDHGSPYMKSGGLWYACGIKKGFHRHEVLEVDNITEIRIIWEDIYYG